MAKEKNILQVLKLPHNFCGTEDPHEDHVWIDKGDATRWCPGGKLFCQNCGNEPQAMTYKGMRFCSENCRKALAGEKGEGLAIGAA